jgi:hypothetical protein
MKLLQGDTTPKKIFHSKSTHPAACLQTFFNLSSALPFLASAMPHRAVQWFSAMSQSEGHFLEILYADA